MCSAVLVADKIWKRYGDRDVLRDVSFSLNAGEAVGYLGPNGAGKSTTLKVLAGIARPTRGTVRWKGADPIRDRARALRVVGALVETPAAPPYLTGGDLLDYVARVRGIPLSERASAVGRAADTMHISDVLPRPIGTLSTGMARRTLLAAALVGDPEVLLLDEPTLGLDPTARADLRRILRDFHRKGLTLLLSTHLLEDVQEVCSRVLFLREGALVGDERVDNLSDGSEHSTRRLRVSFGSPVDPASLARAVDPKVTVASESPQIAIFEFTGGNPEQVAILQGLVRAGFPLLTASRTESELALRYLERVGREDPS